MAGALGLRGNLIMLLLAAPLILPAGAAASADDLTTRVVDPERVAHERLDAGDAAAARIWFEGAAAAGSASAASYLGWLHEQGRGGPRDGAQAAYWFEQAFQAGASEMGLHLAWMYLEGRILERDRARADEWFARAIAAGVSEARIGYGSVLLSDFMADGDPDKAARARTEFRTAWDESGHTQAAYFLGRIHLEGIGVAADAARGAEYLEAGAEAGDPELQGLLAYLYAEGEGVPQSLITALKWATLAAAREDARGEALRGRLKQELSRDEIARAHGAAWQWIREN